MKNLEICEKIIKEQLIPYLIDKDTLSPQFREISSLPLKMGGLNIKLPYDHERYLEWSKETSLVLDSQGPVTAITAIDLAFAKAASNWLNVFSLNGSNFNLNKSEFRDGIYLRYGWEPTKTPLTCVCGANFNVTHALHCAKGGYTHKTQ